MSENSYWNYHLRQYKEIYRSTWSIVNFLKHHISMDIYQEDLQILNVGCGGGANIYWFKKYFPKWKFTGIDIDRKVLEVARKMNRKVKVDEVVFREINFLEIEDYFSAKSFDYIFFIQFLSFVNLDFPIFLKKAIYLAKKGIFLNSLFCDGWIEQYTTAYDLDQGWEGLYKIYSIERFKKIVSEMMGDSVCIEMERFEIDIDIPKPKKPRFGTYTVKTKKGKRLQISGYMLMPWYNVLIKINQGGLIE